MRVCCFVVVSLHAISDDTIFAHDSLRFASGGVGRNLTRTIGYNRMRSDEILPYQVPGSHDFSHELSRFLLIA